MARPGYIYVLKNPAMPGLFKIGRTTRDPRQRAWELSDHTGVPQRYRVAYSVPVLDCNEAERIIHHRLEFCRANRYREFFQADLNFITETIDLTVWEVNQRHGVGNPKERGEELCRPESAAAGASKPNRPLSTEASTEPQNPSQEVSTWKGLADVAIAFSLIWLILSLLGKL